jgi:hypothetical protein
MKFELQSFNRDVPDEDLLPDLAEAHEKLKLAGKCLTFRTYHSVGRFSPSTISDRFGSWNNAVRRVGLIPSEEKNVSAESLFDNLKLVWIAKGKQPVYRDMNGVPSEYTASTYAARFGSWRKALEAFVAAFANEEHALNPALTIEKTNCAARATGREPSLALRFSVLKRDCFRCSACGRSPATLPGLVLEVDHVVAWSKGGNTVSKNLQTLCFDCNRGKSAR